MLDSVRFEGLWLRLGCTGPAMPIFSRIAAAYAEPHRAYHNVSHIVDCLRQFEAARHLADRADEVEAAIWFHDAVYDPRRSDNEQRSAIMAEKALLEAGARDESVHRILAMILATRHEGETADDDTALVLDIDLSILGRERDEFADYDRRIREEYAWVPEDQYRVGRTAVLEAFLNRPAIFRTALFRQKYEAQARRNIDQAIERLRGGIAKSKN